jgi:hypothetical protein
VQSEFVSRVEGDYQSLNQTVGEWAELRRSFVDRRSRVGSVPERLEEIEQRLTNEESAVRDLVEAELSVRNLPERVKWIERWVAPTIRTEMLRKLGLGERNFDSADRSGATPLHKAIAARQSVDVRALLQLGADPNKPVAGTWEPEVIRSGSEKVKVKAKGFTPLMLGSCSGETECAKALREAGAAPNVSYLDGVTPLHLAVVARDVAQEKTLIGFGADPNKQVTGSWEPEIAPDGSNKVKVKAKGSTPLMLCRFCGGTECEKALLDAGADPNKGLNLELCECLKSSSIVSDSAAQIRLLMSAPIKRMRLLCGNGAGRISAEEFKRTCAGKSRTMSFIRTGKGVCGGFLAPAWDDKGNGTWIADESLESFVFSLDAGGARKFRLLADKRDRAAFWNSNYRFQYGYDLYCGFAGKGPWDADCRNSSYEARTSDERLMPGAARSLGEYVAAVEIWQILD